ncbi:hypothetical protein [Pseudomonas sp. GD03944]|uniref:hypothetical protein n=1 Tax=Pseudomonas sp. GD03944 TaxID=2975409 RepID=UPI0024486E07|nr:hypothetical protein [Pseudomonas sp. GD03944]MDH1261392.1 hypothetical protein [Pseudomonas sp. GD03944]
MADFDAPSAVALLGKRVLLELTLEDEPRSIWQCAVIVGVVLPLEGVYRHPHFMVLDMAGEQAFPEEVFWGDIRSLVVLKRHGSYGHKRR